MVKIQPAGAVIDDSRGTFFPGLEGFKEIQNPDIDIFRMYGMLRAGFLPCRVTDTSMLQSRTLLLSQRVVISLERMSSVRARSSMSGAPTLISGII
jgi:hypothetical protein